MRTWLLALHRVFPIPVICAAYQSTKHIRDVVLHRFRESLTERRVNAGVTGDVLIIFRCTPLAAAGCVELHARALHGGGEDDGEEELLVEHEG